MRENIVFYSYKMNNHAHINEHEMKRFEHSISSLREFNDEISVYLFCDDPDYIPDYFRTEYRVKIRPFEQQPSHGMLFIYRWFNLQYFDDADVNILYVDSDVIFYDDVQYLFDHYNYAEVFGREEFGFRHDPNIGGGKTIRQSLDYVDKCIVEAGGKSHTYKYCCGVILFNNNLHLDIIDSLGELVELMCKLKDGKIPYPVPNLRIVDEYAFWIILSRIGAEGSLFGAQDVTHGWIEPKHQEFFNPVACHYTTKKEQIFAYSDEKYKNLIRDAEQLRAEIDPWCVLSPIDHLPQEMIETMAEDNGIIAENLEDFEYEG